MKNKIIIFILFIMSLLLTTSAFADIPRTINYQGKLTDSESRTVDDGSYSITFNLYEQEAGGAPIWFEDQTIVVQKGIFSTQIGATKDLNLTFDKPYWLGIKVGADSEMSPRQPLSSTAYAFQAKYALEAVKASNASVAETLSDETKLVPSGAIIMWSGSIDNIPDGWLLCDGTNSTPDLRDRFIFGAGNKANIGNKRERNLSGTGDNIKIYVHCGARAEGGQSSPEPSQDYMPPYFALAFIMKQ